MVTESFQLFNYITETQQFNEFGNHIISITHHPLSLTLRSLIRQSPTAAVHRRWIRRSRSWWSKRAIWLFRQIMSSWYVMAATGWYNLGLINTQRTTAVTRIQQSKNEPPPPPTDPQTRPNLATFGQEKLVPSISHSQLVLSSFPKLGLFVNVQAIEETLPIRILCVE